MSVEPLPMDPSFPQLKTARDPEQMREIFQRHLRSLGGKAYRIQDCRLYRTRYRRGARCVLQYTLHLAEPDTGRERSQLVTGLMYGGRRTLRLWKELQGSDLGREITSASPTFAPFSYIPDLEMLVQVFPYDHRLPALPLLVAGPPPELEPSLIARFGPGDWQAEAWDIEVVRYLAELRATLRLTVRARDAATGRAEERRFYVKVYHDEEEGEQTYQVLRELWDKASAGGVGYTVGKPIAYMSGFRTLVQEETPGTPLLDILLREDEPAPAMRKVARGLATLHLDHGVTPRRRLLQEEVALLERTGEILYRACPRLRPEIKEIVGAVTTSLEEVPPAPTHCDLHLRHIMLDGGRLALLDFDEFAGADPMLDVARILASFGGVSLPHGRARTAARAFGEEYFAHVPEAWRARLPFHYAGAVLKAASGAFRRQTPGWPEMIETQIKKAKNSLAGRVW